MKKKRPPNSVVPPDVAGYDDYRRGYSPKTIDHIWAQAGLSVSSSILDLACGTGLVLRDLLGRVGRTYGLDLSWEMLSYAASCYGRLGGAPRLVQGRGEELPFAAEQFDLVTMGQSVHWLNLEQVVPDLCRVLRPGGWLAILSKYPSPEQPYRPLYEHLLELRLRRDEPPEYRLTAVSGVSNVLLLEQAGFDAYERTVFSWEVEYTVEGYVEGVAGTLQVQSLSEPERIPFLEDLAEELSRLAQGGHFTEKYLDYLIMARRRP